MKRVWFRSISKAWIIDDKYALSIHVSLIQMNFSSIKIQIALVIFSTLFLAVTVESGCLCVSRSRLSAGAELDIGQ